MRDDDIDFGNMTEGDFTIVTAQRKGKSEAQKKKLEDDPRPHEERTRAELSETLNRFREQGKAERQVYWDNVDSEYWVALCFQSRKQKEEFLKITGLGALGDKYLDGMAVAEMVGVELTHVAPPVRKVQVHQNLIDMAEDF